MKCRILSAAFACIVGVCAHAQEWTDIYRKYDGKSWIIPVEMERINEFHFNSTHTTLEGVYLDAEGQEHILPLDVEDLDSIGFSSDLLDEDKGHNHYRVFTMNIFTVDERPLIYKEEWINCFITIDGRGEYSNYSGTGRIRGRGNSTWEWYDKKPYKFKLNQKSKLLGLSKAKDWNLMANYRDVTDLMNAFAFETARLMQMPNTNHTRFLEVFLNGEYIGLYQLTEKIEVDENRVNINRDGGVLMSLDLDDGPSLSPYSGDNFWSREYELPVCVKYPEDLSSDQISDIASEFAQLERAIKSRDYAKACELMDIESYIRIIQLHEYLYNVEIDAPRSLYFYRDAGGKWTFGPAWDWDAGFDFDWGTMMTGHNFFSDYHELLLGTSPATHGGAAYRLSGFFTDLFNDAQFVSQYKQMWADISPVVFSQPWSEMEKYITELNQGAYARDYSRWPLAGKSVSTELDKMQRWLSQRKTYLDEVIDNYPAGRDTDVPSDGKYTIVGTINKTQNVSYDGGYSQSGKIEISSSEVVSKLGGTPTSLVPLNADGAEGNNTAAGAYGAWFDADGNTASFQNDAVHVYIESNNLWSWSYGCRQSSWSWWGDSDYCSSGHQHTVCMQYRLKDKAVNVKVKMNVQ